MRDSLIKLMPWMGGKGQLMWAIQMLLPIHYKTLVDVFGGSVLFAKLSFYAEGVPANI